MRRKKLSILILFMILVIAFTAAAFSACNDSQPTDEGSTIEATEGLLISNSDFKVIDTSGGIPRTINKDEGQGDLGWHTK